jgi:monothiol glutaredoxin
MHWGCRLRARCDVERVLRSIRVPRADVRQCRALRCHSGGAAEGRPAVLRRWWRVEDGPETHPDFQSKPVASTTDDEADIKAIKDDIVQTIKDEPVVLFIKGSPEAPVCGFSKRVVDLLDALGVEYTSFDVLAHPTVRSYVKEVSNWPTIPQLFIKGEFFGGQDIIFEQAQNGQMQMALERAGIEYRPLKINP